MDIKRIGILITLVTLIAGCQNLDKDDEDDAALSQPPELTAAQESFNQGEYRKAAQQLYPLAQAGNPDAQYALGYLLYEGLGMPQDRMQAYFWIQEAARQGNASALLALEIFEIDPDLPLDEEFNEDIEKGAFDNALEFKQH